MILKEKILLFFNRPTVLANSQYGPNMNLQKSRMNDSFDDRHIIAKHNVIYPTEDEVNFIILRARIMLYIYIQIFNR